MVDFAALKENVRIEEIVTLYNIPMHKKGAQWRGACPVCKAGGDRSLAVNTDKQSYFCFSARQGGDGISLVAHLNNSTQKQAAEEIAKRAGFDSPSHSPPAPDNLQPLVHLISDHPAIEALGLDFQVAEALGIGFAEKGIMKDRVCFPLRTKEGKLTGYVGYNPVEDPMLKFPTKFFIGEAT